MSLRDLLSFYDDIMVTNKLNNGSIHAVNLICINLIETSCFFNHLIPIEHFLMGFHNANEVTRNVHTMNSRVMTLAVYVTKNLHYKKLIYLNGLKMN